jgi:hypothetical protein
MPTVIENVCVVAGPRVTTSTYDPGSTVLSAATMSVADAVITTSGWSPPPTAPRYTFGFCPKFAPWMLMVGPAESRPAGVAFEIVNCGGE